MQAESVTIGPSGKTVAEDAAEIFGTDPHTVVRNLNLNTVVSRLGDAERDPSIAAAGFFTGRLGVADEVDQYLQDLVFVHEDGRIILEIVHDMHVMTDQTRRIHPHGVLDDLA